MKKILIILLLLLVPNVYATDPDSAGTHIMEAEDNVELQLGSMTTTDTSIIFVDNPTGILKWFFPAGIEWTYANRVDSLYNTTLKFVCRTDSATEANGDTAMIGVSVGWYQGYYNYESRYCSLGVASSTWDTVTIENVDYVNYCYMYFEKGWTIDGETTTLDSIKYIEIDSVITEWTKCWYYEGSPTPEEAPSSQANEAIGMYTKDRDVLLEWTASISNDVEHYKIYWGDSTGAYYRSLDIGKNTAWTLQGLHGDTTYYFAVTAVDSAGQESAFSNEVNITFETDTTFWEGDFDEDGDVDGTDLAKLEDYWYETNATYNLVGSTVINMYDLAELAANYDKTGYKLINKKVD